MRSVVACASVAAGVRLVLLSAALAAARSLFLAPLSGSAMACQTFCRLLFELDCVTKSQVRD